MFGLLPRKRGKGVPAFARAMMPRGDFPLWMKRLRDEFDELFNGFMPGWPVPEFYGRAGLEVVEKDGMVVVRVEVPGFEVGDFNVEVCDGYMMMSAVHKVKEEKGEVVEREYHETVLLPPGVDAEKVTAEYRNGVLAVMLPRVPSAVGRKVPITAP
jgi:HSP20 family protein